MALCFVLGVGLAVGALAWQGRHELLGTRIALDALGQPPVSEGPTEPQGLSESTNILVVGDDSGDDLSSRFEDLGAGDRDGHRTDTIILLRIDPQGGKVTGLSFPRDLKVELCDGSVQKINAAWDTGGPDCLVETVRDFAGLRIDHFVQVNFEGFVRIVNAVGGVPLYLDEPMVDDNAHLDLPAGCVDLNGRQALGFVRTRLDSDFGRMARQQRFMKELADRSTSMSVLGNPVRLFRLVDSIGELLTVDDGMSIGTMRQVALTLRGVESDDISLGQIPVFADTSTGVWYAIPVEPDAQQMINAFQNGRLPEYLGEARSENARKNDNESEEASEQPKIPATDLSPITVLNGSNISGLATSTSEALAEAGIEIAGLGDAATPVSGVVVSYPPGMLTEAQSLQVAAFPDAVLELDDTLDTVTLTLDDDVDPDAIEVVGGREPSTPRPTPKAQAPELPDFVNADVDDRTSC